MTLVLVLGNRQNVILLSDRRLTLPDGTIAASDSNKASVLITKDARLAIGYTGFAGFGASISNLGPPASDDFKTAWWLADALSKISDSPDIPARDLIERFVVVAQQDINQLKISEASRGLFFGFAGYSYTTTATRLFMRIVTNLDETSKPTGTFRLQETPDYEEIPPAYMQAYGNYRGLDPDGMRELGELVQELKPAQALMGKATEVMRDAARSRKSGGLVGEDINATVLPRDPNINAVSYYFPSAASSTLYGPNIIDISRGQVLMDSCVIYHDSIAVVPKVGRNQPCPCGSGKKYKWCHARQ